MTIVLEQLAGFFGNLALRLLSTPVTYWCSSVL